MERSGLHIALLQVSKQIPGHYISQKNVYGHLQWNQVQFWLTEVLCIDDTHFHTNVCLYTHKQRHEVPQYGITITLPFPGIPQ